MKDDNYFNKCMEVYKSGGTLWLIERTDTNEFCYRELKTINTSDPSSWLDTFLWSKEISFFTVFFLTKEDAEEELKYSFMDLREGGCHCCGHGATPIPYQITEHEFVKPTHP